MIKLVYEISEIILYHCYNFVNLGHGGGVERWMGNGCGDGMEERDIMSGRTTSRHWGREKCYDVRRRNIGEEKKRKCKDIQRPYIVRVEKGYFPIRANRKIIEGEKKEEMQRRCTSLHWGVMHISFF